MNRIPVRGVGFAAAAVAATSLAMGAPSTAPATPSDAVSNTLSSAVFATAYDAAADSSAAELRALHDARLTVAHATDVARAHRVHLAVLAQRRAQAAASTARAFSRPVVPGTVRALGQSLAAGYGWRGGQFACLDSIWTRESGWRVDAFNPGSGAYGIPQAQPGSKMASAGASWRTNAATQIAWGLAYIDRTYGSPCAAWSFWQSHYWY